MIAARAWLLAAAATLSTGVFAATAHADRHVKKHIQPVSKAPRDGQRDFDFEIGRWAIHVRRLALPSPHYDGLMLRLYDPKTGEWNVYWGSSKSGTLDSPLVGHFTNGRGVTPSSFRTEQDFSADSGKTWQPNLVQTFTRVAQRP